MHVSICDAAIGAQVAMLGFNAPFESPGYACKTPDHDSVARTVCTRGREVFRLP